MIVLITYNFFSRQIKRMVLPYGQSLLSGSYRYSQIPLGFFVSGIISVNQTIL